MITKFTKFSTDFPPKWSNYFRAGDAWLDSYNILEKSQNQIGWGIFYVKPWIVAFCLELFVKAIASHEDKSFNGMRYKHETTRILKEYEVKIPLFHKIIADKNLLLLIKEYENTIDTKFGETSVSSDGDDQAKLVNVAYELRQEISRRTNLR